MFFFVAGGVYHIMNFMPASYVWVLCFIHVFFRCRWGLPHHELHACILRVGYMFYTLFFRCRWGLPHHELHACILRVGYVHVFFRCRWDLPHHELMPVFYVWVIYMLFFVAGGVYHFNMPAAPLQRPPVSILSGHL